MEIIGIIVMILLGGYICFIGIFSALAAPLFGGSGIISFLIFCAGLAIIYFTISMNLSLVVN